MDRADMGSRPGLIERSARDFLSFVAFHTSKKKMAEQKAKEVSAKLVRGFSIAKQWTLQKVGKAQATVESDSFRQMIGALKANQVEIKELTARARELLQANEAKLTAEANFSSAIAKLGNVQSADPQSAAVVQSFVPFSLALEGHYKKLNESYSELLVKPLEALLAKEIKRGITLINKLDMDRLNYDSKCNSLRALQAKAESGQNVNAVELSKAEAEAQAATETYTASKEELINICEVVESRKNAILQEQLAEFAKAQLVYYQDCSQAVKSRGSPGSLSPSDENKQQTDSPPQYQ